MNSSTPIITHTHSDRAQYVPKECNPIIIPATKHGSSHRTPSFSRSSSCSSSSYDHSPLSPATPLRFSGVPFSWEHLPGIPKKSNSKRKETALMKVLPLPPPAVPHQITKRFNFEENGIIRKKNSNVGFLTRDPFFAALLECSKDDNEINESSSGSSNIWSGDSNKVLRSISDRFGFINLYTSCKRTCDVSESVVYLPKSNRTSSFDLITRPSG